MVLTKSELIASLQNEVRILLHLASKIDRAKLDYRPTPKQRSTIELLQVSDASWGPRSCRPPRPERSTVAAWTAAEQAAAGAGLRSDARGNWPATPTITRRLLADVSDADLRSEIEMFGSKTTRGAFIVNLVLCAMRGLPHAAVPLPQGLRPRGAQHDEPLGWRRCAGGGIAARSNP